MFLGLWGGGCGGWVRCYGAYALGYIRDGDRFGRVDLRVLKWRSGLGTILLEDLMGGGQQG